MNREGCHLTLTRRGVLTLAGGAGIAAWSRLYGSNSDFWNKKEPAEWTSAEVDQMITKSPWAKETNAQYSHDRSDGADPDSGGGYPGGGGGGYPSGGGGGYPGGRRYPGGGVRVEFPRLGPVLSR